MQSQTKSTCKRFKQSIVQQKKFKKKSQSNQEDSQDEYFMQNSCQLGNLLQNIINLQTEEEILDDVLDSNASNIISIQEALTLYKKQKDPKKFEERREFASSLSIDVLSQKMYHLGSKKNSGAFFRGDQCERIISIINVGNCFLFNNIKNQVAILEWRTRINGVKPENSSERLSFLEKNYPQLISEYFTSKLDET